MIPWLEAHSVFPDISTALTEEDGAAGLLAAGGDLSPERLLDAYRQGIFPWFSDGQPILWWSTDPRMVLMTADFKISDSLRKKLRQVEKNWLGIEGGATRWEIRFDSAFEQVMRQCAAPRRDRHGHWHGTWITDEIVAGYCALHKMGYAHSSEVWLDGKLVGGAYGVGVGRMFCGESMFASVADASKIALAYLVAFLKANGVALIDCQQETSHLASLGAAPIAREQFLEHLHSAVVQPGIDLWKPCPAFSAAAFAQDAHTR